MNHIPKTMEIMVKMSMEIGMMKSMETSEEDLLQSKATPVALVSMQE